MADKVQPLLERMIPDLEEQQEVGIFTAVRGTCSAGPKFRDERRACPGPLQEEIKAIVNKRRAFEYLLVRRAPEKADYLRYIAYELNLDALRLKRKARLSIKASLKSDHAGPRRVHLIFDRALRRFKSDPALWLQWVDFSLRTGSTKALGKIFPKCVAPRFAPACPAARHPPSPHTFTEPCSCFLAASSCGSKRPHGLSTARATSAKLACSCSGLCA